MSNNIFNPQGGYTERFIKNQGKKIKFPSFKYLDVQLHPKHKDHIVVLSQNEFPEGAKMTYWWETPIYDINNIHENEETKTYFEESLIEAEKLTQKIKKANSKAKCRVRSNGNALKFKRGSSSKNSNSETIVPLFEETKDQNIRNDLNTKMFITNELDSYEGGSSQDDKVSPISDSLYSPDKSSH